LAGLLAVVTTLAMGAGTAAAAIQQSGIHEAGSAGTQAERIPYTTSGDGILFPINPLPRCMLVKGFGGYSGVHGSGGHQGLDIGADVGQAVLAVVDGVLQEQLVDSEGSSAGNGWKLLSHADPAGVRDQYRYYHLDSFAPALSQGDWVSRGDVIGYVGDTGNATPGGWHLHFEVRPGPQPERYGAAAPVDPLPLLDIPSNCVNYLG
jgi:peptidoglycan LD-endopeptidase LytH